jgi:hypothetical protein
MAALAALAAAEILAAAVPAAIGNLKFPITDSDSKFKSGPQIWSLEFRD